MDSAEAACSSRCGPPPEVGGVPALVHVRVTAVELEHPRRHVVEKVAVVCHEHEAASVVDQPSLQPGDGRHIEVVRGLVEDEELGRLRENGGQCDALGLTAGQLGDVSAPGRPHPEPVQGSVRLPTVAYCGRHGPGRELRFLRQVPDADAAAAADLSRSRAPRRRP